MLNQKLLSICIASFNRAKAIENLIQEIIDFDLNDQIEIIVIDDCSPDNTFDAISKFMSFENVTVLRNSTNLGRARTQLKYFNLCKTEYLVELPDDEMLLKDGLLELLSLLPTIDVDYLSTKWIDTTGLYYDVRGSDEVNEISLTRLREQSEHSIGCVFRASIIKLSEQYIIERLDRNCALAFFYHQNIVLCMAKLNNLKLFSSPIVLGGYRADGPHASNFVDHQGNSYRSLSAGFNKYIGMRSFYQEMIIRYHDSPMLGELKALSQYHNLALYGVIDDAISHTDEEDLELSAIAESLRAGSIRNFFNPITALKYFCIFFMTKLKSYRYK